MPLDAPIGDDDVAHDVALLGSWSPPRVLHLWCGECPLFAALNAAGLDVVGVRVTDTSSAASETGAGQSIRHDRVIERPLLRLQLERRFSLVWWSVPMVGAHDPLLRALLHAAMQHLDPGGRLAIDHPDGLHPDGVTALATDFELRLVDAPRPGLLVFERTARFTVHDLVFEARSRIRRVEPERLAELLDGPSPPLVLDTRTPTDRIRFGVIPGSIHVPRTVVEWHIDPANGYRHPEAGEYDQEIVVVCNGGYSSSLAADNLVRLGFSAAGDLVGGHHAWVAAGLPTVAPDHSHLDL